MSKTMEDAIANCEVCQDPEPWKYGSHYHCAECGKVTGMYGHWSKNGFSCQAKKDA